MSAARWMVSDSDKALSWERVADDSKRSWRPQNPAARPKIAGSDAAQRNRERQEEADGRESRDGEERGAKCRRDLRLHGRLLPRRQGRDRLGAAMDHGRKQPGGLGIVEGKDGEQHGADDGGAEGGADRAGELHGGRRFAEL